MHNSDTYIHEIVGKIKKNLWKKTSTSKLLNLGSIYKY